VVKRRKQERERKAEAQATRDFDAMVAAEENKHEMQDSAAAPVPLPTDADDSSHATVALAVGGDVCGEGGAVVEEGEVYANVSLPENGEGTLENDVVFAVEEPPSLPRSGGGGSSTAAPPMRRIPSGLGLALHVAAGTDVGAVARAAEDARIVAEEQQARGEGSDGIEMMSR
jgi:hypothetical protein